jgi:hypothetical protein
MSILSEADITMNSATGTSQCSTEEFLCAIPSLYRIAATWTTRAPEEVDQPRVFFSSRHPRFTIQQQDIVVLSPPGVNDYKGGNNGKRVKSLPSKQRKKLMDTVLQSGMNDTTDGSHCDSQTGPGAPAVVTVNNEASDYLLDYVQRARHTRKQYIAQRLEATQHLEDRIRVIEDMVEEAAVAANAHAEAIAAAASATAHVMARHNPEPKPGLTTTTSRSSSSSSSSNTATAMQQ